MWRSVMPPRAETDGLDPVQAHVAEQRSDVESALAMGEGARGVGGGAVATQVGGDEPVACGRLLEDVAPVGARTQESMKPEEGLSLAVDLEVDLRPVALDEHRASESRRPAASSPCITDGASGRSARGLRTGLSPWLARGTGHRRRPVS